ncbi:hypothetical protein PFICI_14973 [Pestalotiopsis fici W106-1]|uniref:Enoyl reductase (ER) domain-containing protein n=1 Tax=Pestalotiopsis fici (strain W106-1 / CGMCC3.15140) TaxID=1229662 RepID=W3WHJ5_PESFW|nr:uncharacterized protein PFICI_14973 [Pestalotiopsis fici W106-1]ETS73368.1 hypothetical protein PFICI_14973 [Pestalotiopsis fici W106-1]
MDAKTFVTVGSEEKRQFLIDNYDIPPSHIVSPRNVKFAKSILEVAQGRSVDIMINPLTDEMLDLTWRICGDGGTMVEIGKKDIVDGKMLSMEPLHRNCSFRAMDFSYTKDISDPLIERYGGLLSEIFDLVNAGHIYPVHPITTSVFNDVPSALTYIRSGRHIGKVVIERESDKDVRVPIRPVLPRLALQPDVSYLIVGGLKGLCGNLAIYMGQRGAKHIIVCSRSGIADEASQSIVANCVAHVCQVVEAGGDIGEPDFVRQLFSEAEPVISGVVQGAMTLRDKPFETMTIENYHTAIHAKIACT